MFSSRVIEKNRKPSKFRENKEKDEKHNKKHKPIRESRQYDRDDTNEYQRGC